jgi:hypothetical protein
VAQARPEALPPESRPVGQLVAETIRLYGRLFWRALPLGLSLAIVSQLGIGRSIAAQVVSGIVAGSLLLTAAYVAACVLASEAEPGRRRLATAFLAGVLAFAPFPLLTLVFVLPGLAWLALVGLVVPVVVIEGAGLVAAFRRAVALARVDYVHALGSIATLGILYYLTRTLLTSLLRDTGDQTQRIALFLADLVLSPMLFLGAVLLYFDQAARLESRSRSPRRKES